MSLPDPHPSLGARRYTGVREVPGAGGLSRFGSLGLMGFGVLSALGGGGMALLLLAFALFGDPPDPAFAIGMAVFTGIASVVFGGGAGGLGWLWRRKVQAAVPTQHAIAVYEGGVAFTRGGETVSLAWHEVDGFVCPPGQSPIYGVQVRMPYMFFSVMGKGQRFEARSMAHLEDMGKAIEQAVTPVRLAAARVRLSDDQPVSFGSITVTTEGLHGFGIGRIQWADLQGLGVGRMNRLVAKERGVPVGQKGPFFIETPDVSVLFTLVQELRQRSG